MRLNSDEMRSLGCLLSQFCLLFLFPAPTPKLTQAGGWVGAARRMEETQHLSSNKGTRGLTPSSLRLVLGEQGPERSNLPLPHPQPPGSSRHSCSALPWWSFSFSGSRPGGGGVLSCTQQFSTIIALTWKSFLRPTLSPCCYKRRTIFQQVVLHSPLSSSCT